MGETLSSGLLLLGRNIMSITVKNLMSLYIFDGESILKTRIGFFIYYYIYRRYLSTFKQINFEKNIILNTIDKKIYTIIE